jgi:predicted Fe-Mo cluster-binding NifX family protein
MKNVIIALPVFQERLSPLLDEARRFVVLTLNENAISERTVIDIDEQSAFIRIERLKEMGVTVLLCGAVSDVLARFILDREIKLYSWLNGTVEEVVAQYISGTLPHICMRYVTKGQTCRRHRRGWKLHQRSNHYEDSNTGTTE